jgi:hypothetical protein
MPIVADSYDFVVGVGTHAASHTVALIRCPTGQELAADRFPTTRAGLGRLVAWISRRAGDARALVVIEGAGSYGAVLPSAPGHRLAGSRGAAHRRRGVARRGQDRRAGRRSHRAGRSRDRRRAVTDPPRYRRPGGAAGAGGGTRRDDCGEDPVPPTPSQRWSARSTSASLPATVEHRPGTGHRRLANSGRGAATVETFHRSFRRLVGLTPADYRHRFRTPASTD